MASPRFSACLLLVLVLATACTAWASKRRLQGPFDDPQLAAQAQGVFADIAAKSSSYKHGDGIGPSTTIPPYMVPTRCDVTITSLLTVGDAIKGYRFVGIPDGMGAYRESVIKGQGKGLVSKERKDQFVLLINHEISNAEGIPRTHGGNGAFISKWILDAKTMEVLSGEDLIKTVYLWDWTTKAYVQTAGYRFNRFCSADLPHQDAFKWGKYGTSEKIFLNGEEAGISGKAFAHVLTGPLTGTTYQLPLMGTDSWENLVACPYSQKKTIVIGLDDNGGAHMAVYVYVGEKKLNPNGDLNPVEAAGLNNGELYAIKLDGLQAESFTAMPAGGRKEFPFSLYKVTPGGTGSDGQPVPTDVHTFQGYVNSNARGITTFARPEDGNWDKENPKNFYFVSTANVAGVTKMWRLTFNDIEDVTKGGVATIVVNGLPGTPAITGPPLVPAVANKAAPVMMDNICVHEGHVLMQEDTGNNKILARIWDYDIKTGELQVLAEHDPQLYDNSLTTPRFVTIDEESSGIFPLRDFVAPSSNSRFKGDCFLVAQETHADLPDAELVEGGQLLVMCKNAKKCRN